jgi:hypothetical protein
VELLMELALMRIYLYLLMPLCGILINICFNMSFILAYFLSH